LYESSSRNLHAQARAVGGQEASHEAVVTSLSFYNDEDQECLSFETGMPMRAVLKYEVYKSLVDVIFEVQFYSQEDRLCSFFSSETLPGRIDLEPGEGAIVFDCSSVGLGPGVYFIDAGIRIRQAPFGIDIDWRRRCLAVRIDYDRHLRETFYMPYVCRHSPPPAMTTETNDEHVSLVTGHK
jgi:hypothetical protein